MEQEMDRFLPEATGRKDLEAEVPRDAPDALAHDNVLGFAALMNLLLAAAEGA
jgi:hypothetical protein